MGTIVVTAFTPMTLNLSCGKCKAIRTFSGTPPKCEVCGWVCSTTNQRALVAAKANQPSMKSNFAAPFIGLLRLLLFVVPLFVLWFWFYPSSFYGFWYNADSDHVHIQAEPHDCDFLKAPLGFKECHYQRQVEAQKDSKTGERNVYIYWNKVEGN